MPEISVIVPVYKVENYLKKCVNSILAQTFTDFEVWLVDDGSPDNCGLICDEYARSDSRVRVIHKPNGGLSDARNAALEKLSGRYVFFVDSDDWIANDALETTYEAIMRTGAKVATGNAVSVNEDGRISSLYEPVQEETVLRGKEMLSTLLRPNAWNRLYDSSLFQGVRYPKGRLYEDVFVYHKILDQIDSMVLTGKVSYYYLVREGSIMNTQYNICFTDIIDAVYERACWLDSICEYELANETKMFVYSQVAVAFAYLDKTKPECKKRLEEVKQIYGSVFKDLMASKKVSVKQKIRLLVLRYMPDVHTAIWGKKMPINLGG